MLGAWALILPLAADTFAVSAALGMGGLGARDRARVTLLFTAFEGGMPVLGALGGGYLGTAAGGWAHWLAVAILGAAGLLMLFERGDDEGRAERLARSRGPAQLALGLSISMDELAIGFTLGLLRLPLLAACVAIAVQAAVATQVGLRLGGRLSERLRENAERAAGLALLGLAILFVFVR